MSRDSKGGAEGSHRVQRVEREIREVIGSYLLGGFRGELPGFVSVSRVICSKDLRNAKVLVTAHTPENERPKGFEKAIVKELAAYAHQIQHEVNRRLQMKNTPRLTFFYDTGAENALRVDNILHALSEERAKREKSEPESED